MGRAPCCEKYGLKKGPWTPEEDQKLIQYIQKHGHGSWRTLPKNAGLARCGKSCRLRWTNYLRPDIKRGRFSFEEEETIIQLHSILGNKWSAIAARLPGRTDNEIKNYWNTHIRKRLLRMGIDPVTHSPRLDLLDLSSVLGSSLCNPSHVNLSRLLGLQPFMNPEVLRLATNILSSSAPRQNIPTPLPQSSTAVTESPCLSPSHMHASFPGSFDHQAPVVQDHPRACTSSSAPFYGSEAQLLLQQPNGDGFSSCPPDETSGQPNMWQCVNGASSYSGDRDFGSQSCCFSNVYDVVQNGTMDPVGLPAQSSKYFQLNAMDEQNMSFPPPSLLTPESCRTQLNSSVTYVNSSANTTPLNSSPTYNFNGGAEEDRESYCSSMLKFEMPAMLAACEF